MKNVFKIVVCASGGGGNFQALIDARAKIDFEISLLIVDRVCGAIDRAVQSGINYKLIENAKCKTQLEETLNESIPSDTDLIVLAGFMPIVPKLICQRWRGKMINTHPSLLPKYGGKGMYGVKVQEAVMLNRDPEAGCTVHFVSEEIDGGAIILQKSIKVDYRESAWQLGGRIFQEENKLLVESVRLFKIGKIKP